MFSKWIKTLNLISESNKLLIDRWKTTTNWRPFHNQFLVGRAYELLHHEEQATVLRHFVELPI